MKGSNKLEDASRVREAKRYKRVNKLREERGVIAIFMLVGLIVILGFAAIVVDLGMLFVARSELQNAADTGALAGVKELVLNGNSAGQAMAVEYAMQPSNYNLINPSPAADAVDATVLDPDTMSVLVRRANGTTAGAVPTVFARIWGIQSAEVSAVAVATANRRIIGTGPGNLMPFAVHKSQADSDNDGTYDNGATIDIFPHSWSPGNFGLLDLNGGENSNDDIINWILNGYDNNFIIPESTGHLNIGGDTGYSGDSLGDALGTRLFDPVVFPVFDQVNDQGSKSTFRVVDMVGGIIMDYNLQGDSKDRYIRVELKNVSLKKLIAGNGPGPSNSTLFIPVLIQ